MELPGFPPPRSKSRSTRFLVGLSLAWACIALGLGSTRAVTEDGPAHPLDGSWIGWGWLGSAGDLPLRVDFTSEEGIPHASFDSPAHGLRGHPVKTVTWEPPVLELTLTSPGGSDIAMKLRRDQGVLAGSLRWAQYEGTVELVRSPLPLGNVDPDSYADAAGFYERSPGDVVELSPRHWGEMLYRERRTGRLRTLLPLAKDRFFLGSAVYLPAPVEARLRLVRNAAGDVTGLVETAPDGAQRAARRLVLRTEEVAFRDGDVELQGTLLLPDGKGPHPGVIMTGGSSWETRDDVMFQARGLVALGFAALVYDKRGFGASGGERVVPFETTARDALAGVELLRRRDDVAANRVGVFGMSRGGWYAPLAASLSKDVGFLILLVPPAVTPAEQESSRRLAVLEAQGRSGEDLDLERRMLQATWRWVRDAEGWDSYHDLRAQAVARGFPDDVLESDSPDPDEWAWSRLNLFFDPCPTLSRVQAPVIALFGGADAVVDPAVNRPRFEQCLAEGKNRDVTVHTLAGARHNLGVPSGLPQHRHPGSGDEGFRALADWTLEHLPPAPHRSP